MEGKEGGREGRRKGERVGERQSGVITVNET